MRLTVYDRRTNRTLLERELDDSMPVDEVFAVMSEYMLALDIIREIERLETENRRLRELVRVLEGEK